MNRKLLLAGALAVSQGYLMFQYIIPNELSIYISKNERGIYDLEDLARRPEVIVRDFGHGVTQISIVQTPEFEHYLIAIITACLFFRLFYRTEYKKKRITTVEPEYIAVKPGEVKSHPKYNEFIDEDSDRVFFTGEELAAIFSDWLHRIRQKKKNTEQGGADDR